MTLGRIFLLVSGAFVVLLGFAFYQDANREYGKYQQAYFASEKVAYPGPQIYQLFPKVKVNGNFQVERCITCHVPDIQTVGAQAAAAKLGPNHPAVVDDRVFARYGQDTLICRAAGSSAAVSASPAPSPRPAASPSPGPSASASRSPNPGASAAPAGASCQDPSATPFYVLDVNGNKVTDPSTGKPVVAQLTGFIPSQYKGLGIDETGCVICHNGNRQATTMAGGHQNLVANPFNVYDTAPTLYENDCAQCHGATGEGLKGPPLNDQDRLGFFNDDYYYRCIFFGNLGSEHLKSIMPPWGVNKLLPQPIQRNINLLVDWIRMWQQYMSLP